MTGGHALPANGAPTRAVTTAVHARGACARTLADALIRRAPRPIIKVCGVRTPEIAADVADAGAELIGVNFAQISKRRTDPDTAHRITRALRAKSSPVGRTPFVVGIFVEQSAAQIAAIASEVGLDAVQLSGECTPSACIDAHVSSHLPVVAVIRLGASNDVARAKALAAAEGVAAVLVDAPNTVGGAGHAWNHSQARAVVDALALVGMGVIVAGGLHEGNVRAALESSGAWGADVATGVETGGMTDAERVRAFVRAARG